jgi:hypothetical protein
LTLRSSQPHSSRRGRRGAGAVLAGEASISPSFASGLTLFLFPLTLDSPSSGRARVVAVSVLAVVGFAVQFVLMGTWFAKVIPTLTDEYLRLEPPITFVYFWDKSPILGSARMLLAQGRLDTWLSNLWYGWEGHAGAPFAALLTFTVWAVCLAACLFALFRLPKNHQPRNQLLTKSATNTN